MQIKFGKWGVKMFYQSMVRANKKNHVDWPPAENYSCRADIDALNDGNSEHQFDVYYAENNQKDMVLIDIHGGGYIANTRKNNFGFASVFIDAGYDVAALDYPQNKGHLEIIEQIRVIAKQLSFLWVHAEELKLNRDAFFLTGDSAGGHFALLFAEMVSDPEIARKLNIDLGGFRCKGVALNCPVYDFANMIQESPLNAKGKAAMYGPSWNDLEYLAKISPATYIRSLKLPILVSSCRNDFIRSQSERLIKDMNEANIAHEFVFLDEKKKQVKHVHNVAMISLPESHYVNRKMMEFFERQM